MTSFRDNFKDFQLQWLAWMIIVLATLAISLFFGVNYPIPEQPEQPPEPVELGAHFANPVDITGSSSVTTPALTFEGDTNTGLFRSAADTLNIAAGGTEYVEVDSTSVTLGTDVDLANGATIYGSTHTTGTHGMILVCSGSHDHEDVENVVEVCSVPANANVIDYGYLITTAWNDGTGATVNCGFEGQTTDVDAFMDAYDVNGASAGDYVRMGAGATTPATNIGDVGNVEATIRCQVAETDDDASAGAATFYLWYQLD